MWKGSIAFGLVNIPIELYSAVRDHRPKFRLLHAKDESPVHYERICQREGKAVGWEDLVKGYEYEKGQFVVLTKDDFKTAAVEKTKTIDILDFVDPKDVDERYFETPYYLQPGKGSDRAYGLLRQAIEKSGKIGIAKIILRDAQHLAAVETIGDAIVLTMMRFADELADLEDFRFPKAEGIRPGEMNMALQLIDSLSAKWEPEKYTDEYRDNLMRVIQAKLKGKKPRLTERETPQQAEVVDLMERLRASLEGKGGGKAAATRKTAARKKSPARKRASGGLTTRWPFLGSNRRMSLVQTTVDRVAAAEWYARNRRRTRAIFDMIDPAAYYTRPISLRNPIVFYEGHLPAFSIIAFINRGLGRDGVDPRLEQLFARGIDPESEDNATPRSGASTVWPPREEVLQFAAAADALVDDAIRNAPFDESRPAMRRAEGLFTALEHEAMHQETLLYMWHRLPHELKERPGYLRYELRGDAPKYAAVTIPSGNVTLGAVRGNPSHSGGTTSSMHTRWRSRHSTWTSTASRMRTTCRLSKRVTSSLPRSG